LITEKREEISLTKEGKEAAEGFVQRAGREPADEKS
jgi:hypothetical protein